MYLSKLVLDPNHAQARRDLANPYEMHRTLSRVYADSPDSKAARFLWRLEHSGDRAADEGATVLLQSASAGHWQNLQGMPGYTRNLAPDKPVQLDQLLEVGRNCMFRLACNPTVTRAKKRYGLERDEDQLEWLTRQGAQHGFTPTRIRIARSERISFRQGRAGHRITVQVVQFDGLLKVVDPERIGLALVQGIGHAKALGLGMLSIAPIR
ncbi:MAG: type I-E CRISPR-associated protein Cas6/Cse3/CasE [Azoarcus sp. PHD]|nr:MAG: type I-E CRISPR-associated protein Cas6/Cse3/CasE [Azoarcus sp. PHD]